MAEFTVPEFVEYLDVSDCICYLALHYYGKELPVTGEGAALINETWRQVVHSLETLHRQLERFG